MHGRHIEMWSAGGALAAALLLATAVGLNPGRHSEAAAGTTVGSTTTTTTTTTTATAPEAPPEPALRPVVVLYGDSLAWESEELFRWAFADRPDLAVVTRTWGGTAICDYLDRMREDARTVAPGVVVVEFSGNALTPCMKDAGGNVLTGQPYLDKYRADAEAVLDIFLPIGTEVIIAGAPISGVPQIDERSVQIRHLYEQVAAEHPGASYVDAGAAVLDEGRWTLTLPCLAGEPCSGTAPDGTGVNVVRSPDGVHFCPTGNEPVDGVTASCRVWSSGAFRFAMAMAAPVLQRFPR